MKTPITEIIVSPMCIFWYLDILLCGSVPFFLSRPLSVNVITVPRKKTYPLSNKCLRIFNVLSYKKNISSLDKFNLFSKSDILNSLCRGAFLIIKGIILSKKSSSLIFSLILFLFDSTIIRNVSQMVGNVKTLGEEAELITKTFNYAEKFI